jgi:hypothetical protein
VKRRLIPARRVAAAASVVFAVATTIFWVRSHYIADTLTRRTVRSDARRGDEIQIRSIAGRIFVSHTRYTFDTPEGFQLFVDTFGKAPTWSYAHGAPRLYESSPSRVLRSLGFSQISGDFISHAHRTQPVSVAVGTFTTHYTITALPHWPVALVLALPGIPLYLTLRRRLRRRRPPGLCRACGYDLRATPDRCPECGGATPPLPTIPIDQQP